MSPIPWAAILAHGPTILDAAQRLFVKQSRSDARQQSIETRLDQLEKASVESARLLQELAQQVQALTAVQRETARKAQIAFVVSCAAAALGIGAIVLSFVM